MRPFNGINFPLERKNSFLFNSVCEKNNILLKAVATSNIVQGKKNYYYIGSYVIIHNCMSGIGFRYLKKNGDQFCMLHC